MVTVTASWRLFQNDVYCFDMFAYRPVCLYSPLPKGRVTGAVAEKQAITPPCALTYEELRI